MDSQATDGEVPDIKGSRPAAQELTRVVFPKPAGAQTSVNRQPDLRPWLSLSNKRGRTTRFFAGGGMKNLVARRGVDIESSASRFNWFFRDSFILSRIPIHESFLWFYFPYRKLHSWVIINVMGSIAREPIVLYLIQIINVLYKQIWILQKYHVFELMCEIVHVVELILMETESRRLPPPPGLIASLVRGFDSVANHVVVILPPILLDLFLWLGPHLGLKSFFQPLIDQFPAMAKAFPSNFPDLATVQQTWTGFMKQFNLFIILRTFPVGATSLLSLQMPGQSPLGVPQSLDAGSFLGIIGWAVSLALLGWFLGALYYHWISSVALSMEARSLWKSFKQTTFLSVIWLGAFLVFGLPAFMVISVISLFSPFLGQIMFVLGALLLIWLAMPVFFSAHGIFILQLDAFRAILGSLRMVRFTLPNTGLFLLVFVIINTGLNILWNTPSQDSWWMLVGIAGHAFVSTALLAASFIYYRDINAWLIEVFAQLQKQTSSAKAN
jgi:hypothetical protein